MGFVKGRWCYLYRAIDSAGALLIKVNRIRCDVDIDNGSILAGELRDARLEHSFVANARFFRASRKRSSSVDIPGSKESTALRQNPTRPAFQAAFLKATNSVLVAASRCEIGRASCR